MQKTSSNHRSPSIVTSRRRRGQKGIAVLITAIMMLLALPMMGLMLDSTLLFIIKARLQASVDAAALAGARGLARGADGAAQITSAQTAAANAVHLNIADNSFFGGTVTVPTPAVGLGVAFQRTVTVSASVVFPGMILKYISGPTTVNASAAVTRKDVNVVMVIDRSGSLTASGSCGGVQAAAANFVDQFAPARDNVGLVTFASSAYVNFPIANTFASATPTVKTLISNMVCAGSTSSAMALWKGYDQLVSLNEPGALNVLLFFTDGQPTGVTLKMPVANGSPCTAFTAGNAPNPGGYTLPAGSKGYLTGVLNTFTNSNQFFGLLDYAGSQTPPNGDLVRAPNYAGCNFASGWANDGGVHNMTDTSDFVAVPVTDIYGSSLNNGYQLVTMSGTMIDVNNDNNAPAIALNAADDAAARIRAGAVDSAYGRGLSNVLILSIGLGTATIPASDDFLERVSNDARSSIYDSTKPTGHYYDAPTLADLEPAFEQVASEILRLAK